MQRFAYGSLIVLLIAGCVSSPQDPSTSGSPHASLPAWKPVCANPVQANWTDPCSMRATLANGPANENWLAVNPTDPRNVVVMAKDYNPRASDCVWIGVMVTHDGGATWKNSYLGGEKADRKPTDPDFTYSCNTDPMFTFDAKGTLYAVQELYGSLPAETPLGRNFPAGGNLMQLATSHDGGDTFGPWTAVSHGDSLAVLQDRTMLTANPKSGSVHFAWSQRLGADTAVQVLVATTRDEGASWEAAVTASDVKDPRSDLPVTMAALPDGTLVVAWTSFASGDAGDGDLRVTTSSDDGRTFAAPHSIGSSHHPFVDYVANSKFYVVADPQLAADPRAGSHALYLTWNAHVGNRTDVFISRSGDAGATWTAPVPVAGVGTNNDRFHGALAVDGDGAVHVTFFDRQYGPANQFLDVSLATATNSTNLAGFTLQRLTASSFDGDLGYHQSGVQFIGDYNGLAVVGKDLYASYPDTRMGRSDIAVAHLVLD